MHALKRYKQTSLACMFLHMLVQTRVVALQTSREYHWPILYILQSGPVSAELGVSLPSRQILLVSWLAEPIIEQHDGTVVCSVPDAPAYRLVQRPTPLKT